MGYKKIYISCMCSAGVDSMEGQGTGGGGGGGGEQNPLQGQIMHAVNIRGGHRSGFLTVFGLGS